MLTTTIGAYPKPAAVPIRDWFQKEGGTDTPEPTAGYAETLRQYGARLEAILDRATTLVVREQVELGIDIPTDGEIRRENFIHYHCRHLRGIDFDALTERQMRDVTRNAPADHHRADRGRAAVSRARLAGGAERHEEAGQDHRAGPAHDRRHRRRMNTTGRMLARAASRSPTR